MPTETSHHVHTSLHFRRKRRVYEAVTLPGGLHKATSSIGPETAVDLLGQKLAKGRPFAVTQLYGVPYAYRIHVRTPQPAACTNGAEVHP